MQAETIEKVEKLAALQKRGQNCATLHAKLIEEIKI